ncbi:MAG: glycine cleavage system aminomethyltransferase GcvT [Anaerolineales bacterium]
MPDLLFRGGLGDLDPDLSDVVEFETERQYRKLILIPSESTAPQAVLELLSTPFNNVYAEGYPDEDTRRMPEAELLDVPARLAHYRRYSDPRYYKGVEYVDIVESLARRRCAEAFATNGLTADDLYVNVQALSGAPANNAVYHALMEPGETVLGMNLLHGGHLTHGSPVNRSGQYYHAVHYTVDPETERLDYEQIAAIAREHMPKMIIAGYSSYSWAVDWAKFRAIADEVGAYLLADIAHVAGLVAAGAFPSPVGYADVITFTTHKSMCGPRGAVIMTASRKLSSKIDRAVFPGEQGGPHINTIAAQALAFKLAASDQFKQLQHQIVANCRAMTEAIEAEGLRIPFGGTDTHLTNVDCKSVVGEDGTTLSGDLAARILDVAGIVVNRQTIPGDKSAFNPSGIRLGTPWITQRGFKEDDSRKLGKLIARLLKACVPYSVTGRKGKGQRAKVDFETLNEVRIAVRDMAEAAGIDTSPEKHGYPQFYFLDDPAPDGDPVAIEIDGDDAEAFLAWATTARTEAMAPGESSGIQITAGGKTIEAGVSRPKEGGVWTLTVPASSASLVLTWLRDLSDGYILVDPADPDRKLPGPVIVRQADGAEGGKIPAIEADGHDKPWYVGVSPRDEGDPLPAFAWDETESEEPRKTALNEAHRALGAKMVPFAGWDMPVWYTSVIEEHLAVRHSAGLFDVSHMGVYQAEGEGAAAFLDSVVGNDVAKLEVGQSHYTQFLRHDGHVIDDLMIYRRGPETYLMVVNAANDDKDWAWLQAVKSGTVRIDENRPWSMAFGRDCRLRNLRDPEAGADMRVDIALQGPNSRDILLALGTDDASAAKLKGLKWAGLMEGRFGAFDLVVSRTGYTGERVAFELFVHPDKSPALWEALLKAGEPMGLKPAGLGARDSLRTEAGLPLYGHEMAGDLDLGVGDAGFGAYVKTYKPWFIGRSAFLTQEAKRSAEVVRFRFDDKGVRMAHSGDPVVDHRGKVVGKVTSCAVDSEGYLLGQAYVDLSVAEPGTPLAIFQGGVVSRDGESVDVGDRVQVPTPATVLTRFPK